MQLLLLHFVLILGQSSFFVHSAHVKLAKQYLFVTFEVQSLDVKHSMQFGLLPSNIPKYFFTFFCHGVGGAMKVRRAPILTNIRNGVADSF